MKKNSTTIETLRGPVALSHLFLRERVKPGDRVVDATCGNGHDTMLLAGLVGREGKVWSFDIQEAALQAVRAKLDEASLGDPVELVHAGHERMAEFIDGSLQAAVFNLGYLPGSDRETITRPKTTLSALDQAARLLDIGGIILVVVYVGHPGGAEEGGAVDSWATKLPSTKFNVWCSRLQNRQAQAPYLLLVEKMRR